MEKGSVPAMLFPVANRVQLAMLSWGLIFAHLLSASWRRAKFQITGQETMLWAQQKYSRRLRRWILPDGWSTVRSADRLLTLANAQIHWWTYA